MRPRLQLADEVDPWPTGPSVDAFILDHARLAVRPWEVSMLLREKGKKDAEPVGMGWDEAQAAIRAGTHEVAGATDTGSEKAREGEANHDLDGKTKADLEALAKERGLDVSAARTKADLIEALRKA